MRTDPEPQRSDFLDLLFAKKGGAAFQILKTEIAGDGDSSYGSEAAVMHTANRAEDNIHEGYETWLLGEAKKRNPQIPTYCLSWTVPGWAANGSEASGLSIRQKPAAWRSLDALVGSACALFCYGRHLWFRHQADAPS